MGAFPDVYTITLVAASDNSDELIVTFSLNGNVGAAPETQATLFTVSCGNVTQTSNGSPVILTGLSAGEDYTCTVVASNATGSSSASTGVIGTTKSGLSRSSALKIILMLSPPVQN
ncbi:fibronectin type III domain-containing protein [sulfur-oxidizing endosymbiont of Gigantopelta aegis]|uniref:fibronectin type III domain-containing protein n=1 Tax=sulfur-oxidizing endosymbiont of Gigantopelta aegis TaxID=2794934 RepID=UPI0018DCC6D0|nr:fibronectin type III domain-containing protein [sulfur-oxidizing endosymbiont of Gigantopelta aegis]